jgi:thioredoxin-like negative regulator of GroEL
VTARMNAPYVKQFVEERELSIGLLVDVSGSGDVGSRERTKNELATELAGQMKVAKVNVDENQQLAGEFGIRSIPTLLILKDGVVQEQMVGALNKATLKEKVDAYL